MKRNIAALERRLRALEAAAPPPASIVVDFSALTPEERRFIATMLDRAIEGEKPNGDADWVRCEAIMERVHVVPGSGTANA